MPLKISYPFKPYVVTQKWNNPNPAYEAAGFPFKNHNGIDATVGGNPASEWPVYCPVEGFTVKKVDYAPQGGGNEVWMISNAPITMGDRDNLYAYLVLCHAKKIFIKPGDTPKLGELLMIADNTGFSTGPHTHMGLYRVNYDGRTIEYNDVNDANGSYDPSVFFTGEFAIDKAELTTLINNNWMYYQYVLGLI